MAEPLAGWSPRSRRRMAPVYWPISTVSVRQALLADADRRVRGEQRGDPAARADRRREEEGVERLLLAQVLRRDLGHLRRDMSQRVGQRRGVAGQQRAGTVGGQLAVAGQAADEQEAQRVGSQADQGDPSLARSRRSASSIILRITALTVSAPYLAMRRRICSAAFLLAAIFARRSRPTRWGNRDLRIQASATSRCSTPPQILAVARAVSGPRTAEGVSDEVAGVVSGFDDCAAQPGRGRPRHSAGPAAGSLRRPPRRALRRRSRWCARGWSRH